MEGEKMTGNRIRETDKVIKEVSSQTQYLCHLVHHLTL